MGDFQGGLFWVESEEGRALPPYTAPGLGPEVKRSNHVTKGKWLSFDGSKWHAVTPTKGLGCHWCSSIAIPCRRCH
eukprot:12920097-Prorocentrum_lima.AAC.1